MNENYKIVQNYLTKSDTKHRILMEKGVVIKIDSYTDGGVDYHNHWGVIMHQYQDNGDYRVFVNLESGFINVIHIQPKYIKHIIGTRDMDCVGIGFNRHKTEVIPLIEKSERFL